jgi:SAM-dependent methyltransferase
MPLEEMDIDTLRRERERVIARHGDWTDHNIHITGDLYTIGEDVVSTRLRRIVQIVADVAREPLSGLRVLDLACLEGLYAIEFARQGAETVAIEAREASLEKARFVRDALRLDNLTLCQDDVRNLCPEKYGEFDVALCLGILYHLDAPDVFHFAESLGRVTRRFAVIDTYVASSSRELRTHEGRQYWGREIHEHFPTDSREERLGRLWASLDNPKSLWLTRWSLFNLLSACGFTTVYECQVPADVHKPADRVTLLAIKGAPQTLLSTPKVNELPVTGWPENHRPRVSPDQDVRVQLSKRLSWMVPDALKRPAKAALRSLGLRRREGQPWRAEPRPPRNMA